MKRMWVYVSTVIALISFLAIVLMIFAKWRDSDTEYNVRVSANKTELTESQLKRIFANKCTNIILLKHNIFSLDCILEKHFFQMVDEESAENQLNKILLKWELDKLSKLETGLEENEYLINELREKLDGYMDAQLELYGDSISKVALYSTYLKKKARLETLLQEKRNEGKFDEEYTKAVRMLNSTIKEINTIYTSIKIDDVIHEISAKNAAIIIQYEFAKTEQKKLEIELESLRSDKKLEVLKIKPI